MRRVSLGSLNDELRDFFVKLRLDETPVIVEDGGRAVAAVVTPWQLESWEQNRQGLLRLVAQLREANSGVLAEQIEADIDAALREVRMQPA